MAYRQPDNRGHFEEFGGKYVPEILIPAITELENLFLVFNFQIIRKRKVIIRAVKREWIFRMQIMKTWNESC